MTLPLVSVLVITYNQRAFIEQSLRSAADQDYPNVEVVVGDDGSTDGTAELVLEIAAQYPLGRIVPIVGEGHLGITGNCNRVLQRCQGKYLALFAGDDQMLPGKLSKQVAWMEEDENRIACGHDVEVFESETDQAICLFSSMAPLRRGKGAGYWIEHGSPVPPLSLMFRRSRVPAWGFDERLRIASDWKFWIDTMAQGGEYGYVDGTLTRYRRHASQATRLPPEERWIDTFITLGILESMYPHLIGTIRRARRARFISKGMSHFRRGDVGRGRRYVFAALRGTTLLQPRTWAGLVLALLPGGVTQKLLAARPRLFE